MVIDVALCAAILYMQSMVATEMRSGSLDAE